MKIIDERNEAEVAAGGSGVHGITKFMDMSEEEFNTAYLGYKSVPSSTIIERRQLDSSLENPLSQVISFKYRLLVRSFIC
jgi:hypothetical protein